MDEEYRKLYEAMVDNAYQQTDYIAEALKKPWETRRMRRRIKLDKSHVTRHDFKIGDRSADFLEPNFPNLSFSNEEMGLLFPGQDYEWHEDPLDGTFIFTEHDSTNPTRHRWVTYLASVTCRRQPVMYAVGVPLEKDVFSGAVGVGTFKDRKPWRPVIDGPEFVLGFDEHERAEEYERFYGYCKVTIVGAQAYSMLTGHAVAGMHSCDKPYELNCLAAIANVMGATMTDEFGNEFKSGFGADAHWVFRKFVWSVKGFDHSALLLRTRKHLRNLTVGQ